MNSSDAQAVIVLTRPASIHLLDLLLMGVTDEAELVQRTVDRLGIADDHALEILRGLVRVGFAAREPGPGSPRYSSMGEDHFRRRLAAARHHVDWLRSQGDCQQADDIDLALDAAWDARSADPARKLLGRSFIHSEAGQRFAARTDDFTLGYPAPEVPAASTPGAG